MQILTCAEAATAPNKAGALPASPPENEADARERREQLRDGARLRRSLLWGCAVAASIAGLLALWLGVRAMSESREYGLRLASYWGGFGGTGTGWQLSPAAVKLLAAALLGLSALVLIFGALMHAGAGGASPAPEAGRAPAAAPSQGAGASGASAPIAARN